MRAAVGVLVLALAASAAAEEPAVHEDADYRFRITSPGSDWRLLPELEARKLVPDAIAGLTDLKGANFVVIAEEAPGANLDAYARVLRENMPVENADFGEVETVTFQSHPARRWNVRGKMNGLDVRFRNLLVARGDFLFQILGFQVGSSTRDLDTLAANIVLTPGPIRPRRLARATHDVRGVGWRIQGGVYQDAANGVEVRPPEGWRLVVGTELNVMNDSACVGLISADPDAYVILIVERARGVDREAFLAKLRANVAESSGGSPTGSAVPDVVGGREFAMRTHRVSRGASVLLHHGARIDGDRAVQVQAWHVEGVAARVRPRLVAAYAAIRFLDEPSRAALAKDLLAAEDPQDLVGPGYSLRRGVLQDFEHRFTWTKPAGFWEVTAGQEARAGNPDTTVSLAEVSLGLQGQVIAEEMEGVGPLEFHNFLLERLEPKDPLPEPTRLDLDGTEALFTEVRPGILDLPMRYAVTSVVKEGRAYQLLFWGLEGNVETTRPNLLAAVRAFRFPPGLVTKERRADVFVDHRLGWRLRRPAGPGWRFTDATPPGIAAAGTVVVYEGPGSVVGGAFSLQTEEQDERFIRDMILNLVRQRGTENAAEASESNATLAGLPARRIALSGTKPMVVLLAQRGRRFYLLVVETRPGAALTEEGALGLIDLID
jgi:hypothetical protein